MGSSDIWIKPKIVILVFDVFSNKHPSLSWLAQIRVERHVFPFLSVNSHSKNPTKHIGLVNKADNIDHHLIEM
jgi:hypothetical protein